MSKKEQIFNWLTSGIQQPPNNFSELFYYDRRGHEFFSILISDYFIFDENLNINENTTTSYTKENLECLKDRFRRIDNNDDTIIALPRLGIIQEDNKNDIISQQISSFLSVNSINIETATIWEPESGVITIHLKKESTPITKRPWWKIWK